TGAGIAGGGVQDLWLERQRGHLLREQWNVGIDESSASSERGEVIHQLAVVERRPDKLSENYEHARPGDGVDAHRYSQRSDSACTTPGGKCELHSYGYPGEERPGAGQ